MIAKWEVTGPHVQDSAGAGEAARPYCTAAPLDLMCINFNSPNIHLQILLGEGGLEFMDSKDNFETEASLVRQRLKWLIFYGKVLLSHHIVHLKPV